MAGRRGRPKKDTVIVQTTFSLPKEAYEKMKEVMKKRGFDQVGTFLKSLILKEINQA